MKLFFKAGSQMVLIDFIVAGIYHNLKTLEIQELLVIYFAIYIFARTIERLTSKKIHSLFLKAETPVLKYLLLIYFLIPVYQWSTDFSPDSLLGQVILTGIILTSFVAMIQKFIFGSIHVQKSNAFIPHLIRWLMTKNGKDKLSENDEINKDAIVSHTQTQISDVREKIISFVTHFVATFMLLTHIAEINLLWAIAMLIIALSIILQDFKEVRKKWHYFRNGHIATTKKILKNSTQQ